MKEQNKKSLTIKDVISNNKSIVTFIVMLLIANKISSLAAEIPQKKEDEALKIKNMLSNEKYEIEQQNQSLQKKIKSEENKNSNLNNKIDAEEGTSFKVKAGTVWSGTYNLFHSEDTYKLTLEINEHNAIFNFTHGESKGSFYMGKNTIEPNSGYIELQCTEWKDVTSGYDMVNLSGVANGDKMNGLILDYNSQEKLGSFSLTKLN